MTTVEPTTPGVRTEADVDARIVMPYLAALGVQPDQVRAQHTFSLRLGRNMIYNVGGPAVRTGRLDHLVVTADGRPLFVVEEKGPGEVLTDDDRDQGISYARLVDPMAPLVLVTNGSERRLYDTVTRERLDDAGAAALVRGGGRLTDDESLRIRAEALEHFVGYSAAHVAAFSRAQHAERMATLRGEAGHGGGHTRKYETDLYQRRDGVRRAFDAFLDSPCVVFALGAPSGFGKTNEMCALAEAYGATHVTLFFSGAELAGPLAQVLADEFDWHFSEALPLPQICRRLSALAARSGRPVLVFVDAVDEAGDPGLPQQLSDLASRLEQFGGRIRLVVSAKPEEWQRFTTFRDNPSPLRGRVFVRSGGLVAPGGAGPLSAVVDLFTPQERDEAVAAYTAAFGLRGEWSHAVREAARDPFMLRMIAEVAAETGVVPDDPGERELVRHYLAQKLRRTADPERSRRELAAVAKALADHAGAADGAHEVGRDVDASGADDGPPGDDWRDDARVAAGWAAVPESAVRATAGLAATAAVADELVAFGVLLRSRDREGSARLAFAYDRVRDYALATYAFGLPTLGRERFRATSLACLASDAGAAALSWYLPYMGDDQWDGFLDAATGQVERLANAYGRLCAHVAPAVRAHMDPHTTRRGAGAIGEGEIGAAFAGNRRGGFALGFFHRASADLPRACFDPAVGDFEKHYFDGGRIPARLMGTRQMRAGFWYLRDPERFAAAHFTEQLQTVVKKGQLLEADETLVAERVVALAIERGPKLGWPHTQAAVRPPVVRFADHFVGRDLFPLDLVALRRVVQTELGFRSYQQAHMDERAEEERRRHRMAGVAPQTITAVSNWTEADLRAWRERAAREVDGGRDFTDSTGRDAELSAFARAVDALLRRTARLDHPLLPHPDVPDNDPLSGVHNFEDGYTDEQLTRFVEVVFDRARRAYDRVMADSLSEGLRAVLRHPPERLGVVCFRLPVGQRPHPQFGTTLEYGAASPVDPGLLDGRRAIAATVSAGGAAHVARVEGQGWGDTLVTTPGGRFLAHVRHSAGFARVVWPFDAPAFGPDGRNGAGRLAPVRAMVYRFAHEAVADLSPERLRTLIGGGPD